MAKVNDSGPVSVPAVVKAERCGARRAAPWGTPARWRPVLLIIAVVAGLLAMHTATLMSDSATPPPALAAQVAVQAAPVGPGDGPGGCPCVTDCSDMSACQALTVTAWSPAQHAASALVGATMSDAPTSGDGQPSGRAPTRPPIGLRVTAVTVTRI
jgi:hypothetical protein